MSGAFLDDDLDVFMDTDVFAVVGVVNRVGGARTNISGIFDDEDVELDSPSGNVIIQKAARFRVKTEDVVNENDTITFSLGKPFDGTYVVRMSQDDGVGTTSMWLEKTS